MTDHLPPKNLFALFVATGLMLFALFFGAGNLIFPAHMGQQAGDNYLQAVFGFILPLLFGWRCLRAS